MLPSSLMKLLMPFSDASTSLRILFVLVAQRLDLRVAEERVVVEVHLRVEREHAAVRR